MSKFSEFAKEQPHQADLLLVLFSIIGGLILGAIVGAALVYSHMKPAAACDCWEHKPMPFCEVIGSPVGGKIAVMPDVIVSTDP